MGSVRLKDIVKRVIIVIDFFVTAKGSILSRYKR